MIAVIMLVKDRPALTRQSLQSLASNTVDDWNLIIVNDGSAAETYDILIDFELRHQDNVKVVRYWPNSAPVDSTGAVLSNLGAAKNCGVLKSKLLFPIDEYLYLSDNDVYFTPGWDRQLIGALRIRERDGFRLLGGQNHPFHCPIGTFGSVLEYGAVAGTSWLLSWDTWQEMGPLVETGAGGVGQSEDHEYCQRIRAAGYRVGAIYPNVVIDTGITQTDGALSVGHDVKVRVPGVIYG